jgi:hypothetical protein
MLEHNWQEPRFIFLLTFINAPIAVMVGNETLFIVFGKDTASIATSSAVVLNVTNPNKIVYIDKYFSPMNQDVLSGVNLTDLPNADPIKPGGLTSGAVAGIAVGSVIAVRFFLFNAKKKKFKNMACFL